MTKPLPRLRDAERTRAAILQAAQEAFSTRGYAAAGVREITATAGVNPALVSRYFGSKEALFEAALADLLDVSLLTGGSRSEFGERLVAGFTRDYPDRINPLQMLVLATGDPVARPIADRLLRERIMEPLTAWFDRPDAAERAARLMVLASGFFLYRLLYPLEGLTGAVAPASRAWLVRAFQSLIDEPA